MIEELKKTIDSEIEMLAELSAFMKRAESSSAQEQKLLLAGIDSLVASIKRTNNLIPSLLDKIIVEPTKKHMAEAERPKKIMLEAPYNLKESIVLQNREDILRELNLNESLLKRLKKKSVFVEEKPEGFKKARGYLKLANRLFLDSANKLIKKGYFGALPSELKKANLDMLFETYIAMMFFTVIISFGISILLTGALLIAGQFNIFWIPLFLPVGVFFALYLYPSTEAKSIEKKIDEEIPFAVIHMSSISGSGIAPTEIFRIIGLSRDYPFLRKEIMKILNQINIYGYDLVTALNNVSKSTSSSKLAELLAGMSTTINSGGNLSEFFQKRAEMLLMGYRLEKEKFIKLAETFMDIYISVVIAAPMILMLLLVMISVSGINIGLTAMQMTMLTIGGVALINIIFLGFLQVKQ